MKFNLARITRLLLFMTVTFGLYAYLQVDGEVPIHFDAEGEPDESAPKMVLLIIPFAITIVYVFLQNMARDKKLVETQGAFGKNKKAIELVNLALVLLGFGILWYIYQQK